jgi:hypothetical protein
MKQRRRWFAFTYHHQVQVLCKPREEKHLHDELLKLIAQTISDFTGEPTCLRDCKTGRFKGSVRPRR